MNPTLAIVAFLALLCVDPLLAGPEGKTRVSIVGENFHINEQPTYAGRSWNGHRVEGLLLNSRMVQHAILKPARVHELIERVHRVAQNGRRLLVGTSYGGGALPGENVLRTSDFLLLHGNGAPTKAINPRQ